MIIDYYSAVLRAVAKRREKGQDLTLHPLRDSSGACSRMTGNPETDNRRIYAFQNQVVSESRACQRSMLKNKGLRGMLPECFWKGVLSMPARTRFSTRSFA